MTIYIVTARYGNEMESPVVFKTKNEAEQNAHDYVFNCARDFYNWYEDEPVENITDDDLKNWASENNYELWDNYWWNGYSDACESDVTEVTIDL